MCEKQALVNSWMTEVDYINNLKTNKTWRLSPMIFTYKCIMILLVTLERVVLGPRYVLLRKDILFNKDCYWSVYLVVT